MKRAYRLEGHICGNCAAKIENKVAKLDGVNRASVNIVTMRFMLDADDAAYDAALEESKRIFARTEPSCTLRA